MFSAADLFQAARDLPFLTFLSVVCSAVLLSYLSKYALRRGNSYLLWKIKRLKACEKDLAEMISKSNCNPIMLRLAWSDAGTYDRNISDWPLCGGCNGSIRLDNELSQSVNKGLAKAIALLYPIKNRYPSISWAELGLELELGLGLGSGLGLELHVSF
jgi:hypothetical protein